MSFSSKYRGVERIIRRIFRWTRKWLRSRPTYVREFVRSAPAFIRGDFSDLAHAPPAAKRIISAKIGRAKAGPWALSLPTAEQVERDCRDVFDHSGLWPLSYAYPFDQARIGDIPERLLSPLFPGHRYKYENESDYLDHYRSFAFSMTHKKAGWDCFRHVEIMHVGGIPFMPDAPWIPAGTMVHYPKEFFAYAVDRLMESGDIPPEDVFIDLGKHFNEHLTTAQMARYMMRSVGMDDTARVLFIDEAAVKKPDYTSNLTFIGLKQVLATQVHTVHRADYMYRDWTGKARTLYGRGFGYSRVLDPAVKSRTEKSEATFSEDLLKPEEWDWVVVGSAPRNPLLTQEVLRLFPAERTILLHGEDIPLTPEEAERLRGTGAHIFVREISSELYSGRKG